jgi:hypothetical protein
VETGEQPESAKRIPRNKNKKRRGAPRTQTKPTERVVKRERAVV